MEEVEEEEEERQRREKEVLNCRSLISKQEV